VTNQPTIQPFLDDLAGGSASPGGGSAAAAAGAMGAALAAMVCRLTIGKKKYAAVEAQMQAMLPRAEALRAELTRLISADAAAFDAVMAAFRLPKETDADKAARQEAIQAATQQATLTPLATARACAEVIELCHTAAGVGNSNAVSDAGAGAACAQAGLRAASLNVLINLPAITDAAFVAKNRAELDQILANHGLADEVYELVKSKI
jgi:formiminotetrahydrofolate cyclodeaminase